MSTSPSSPFNLCVALVILLTGQVAFSAGLVSSQTGYSCWALVVGWGLLLVGLVPADVGVPCAIPGSFCRHARSSATVLVGIPGRQATLASLVGADGLVGVMSPISTSC